MSTQGQVNVHTGNRPLVIVKGISIKNSTFKVGVVNPQLTQQLKNIYVYELSLKKKKKMVN